MKYDLHVHSIFSDGDHTPEQLAHLAKQSQITKLVIADHNTTDGLSASRTALKKNDLFVCDGIEFSAYTNGHEVHILGYANEFNGKELSAVISSIQRVYNDHIAELAEAMRADGLQLPRFEDLLALRRGCGGWVPNYDLYRFVALNSDMRLRQVRSHAKEKWVPSLKNKKQGLPDPKQVIDSIHAAGGIAIFAHPGRSTRPPEEHLQEINQLIQFGLDGIEVFTPRHTSEQKKAFSRLAHEQNLLVTGGSDFHGLYNQPDLMLGKSDMSNKEFDLFVARIKKRDRNSVVAVPIPHISLQK